MAPPVGFCNPAIRFSRVLLPQPDGPTIVRNSPRRIADQPDTRDLGGHRGAEALLERARSRLPTEPELAEEARRIEVDALGCDAPVAELEHSSALDSEAPTAPITSPDRASSVRPYRLCAQSRLRGGPLPRLHRGALVRRCWRRWGLGGERATRTALSPNSGAHSSAPMSRHACVVQRAVTL